MPRPLIGAAALTPAERQARRRDRFRETMAENERLREGALSVLAAAVAMQSIITRAQDMKKKPSMAVGSDAMFQQMLVDYERAISKARVALAE